MEVALIVIVVFSLLALISIEVHKENKLFYFPGQKRRPMTKMQYVFFGAMVVSIVLLFFRVWPAMAFKEALKYSLFFIFTWLISPISAVSC